MRPAFQTAHNIAAQALYVKQNYKRAKSLSLAYVRYRILRPMLKIYNWMLKLNTSHAPWMGPAAIRIFKSIINKDMRGFEYGSGSSTVFFASLSSELVSIEHHEGWYKKVQSDLETKSVKNVDYHLIKAKLMVNPSESDNDKIINSHLEFMLKNFPDTAVMQEFRDYFSFIDSYENAYFDFVIVDGRARTECVCFAMDKIKPGGFIVLANAERNRYKPVHSLLKDWKKVYTTTGLTDTIFWFKPNEQGS
jgi:tRNA A58 N-methylase Trm61